MSYQSLLVLTDRAGRSFFMLVGEAKRTEIRRPDAFGNSQNGAIFKKLASKEIAGMVSNNQPSKQLIVQYEMRWLHSIVHLSQFCCWFDLARTLHSIDPTQMKFNYFIRTPFKKWVSRLGQRWGRLRRYIAIHDRELIFARR